LIKNSDSENVTRLPVLSKIPILGSLFKSPDFKNNQTELVISLTTTIVKPEEKKAESLTAKAAPPSAAEKKTALVKSAEASVEKTTVEMKELPDYLVDYARTIQEKISQAATYPEEARQLGWEGTVNLDLRILSDGTLAEVKVKQSSGYEVFDKNAIDTAKKQSPYPIFPAELRTREISIEVPVVYSLTPDS
jgi:TonB family protein